MAKKNYGKRNRTMGHDAERHYARVFVDIGYKRCITSRRGSRIHDESGIDLIEIPFNVQVKAGKQRGLNFSTTLQSMDIEMRKNFSDGHPTLTKPKIVIWRKNTGKGIKRTPYHDLVITTFEDFQEIIKPAKKEKDDNERKS